MIKKNVNIIPQEYIKKLEEGIGFNIFNKNNSRNIKNALKFLFGKPIFTLSGYGSYDLFCDNIIANIKIGENNKNIFTDEMIKKRILLKFGRHDRIKSLYDLSKLGFFIGEFNQYGTLNNIIGYSYQNGDEIIVLPEFNNKTEYLDEIQNLKKSGRFKLNYKYII